MKTSIKIMKYNDKIIKFILKCKDGNVLKNSFVRKRDLTFEDIVLIEMARKGKTTRMELFDFYRKIEKKAVSKQDYSKQRMKIKENFWIEANQIIVKEFYQSNQYTKLGKYILLAIDGSKTILPRCKELEEKYGLANANNSQQKCVQCLISGCYDVLNNMMLDIQIAPYKSSERALAKENIKTVKQMMPDKDYVFVFDRGYPSVELFHYMEEMGVKYIIRLQSNTYENEKRNMKSDDEIVEIKLNKDKLAGKMSEETRNTLKAQKIFKTRFVRCRLNTGTEEFLATNLSEQEITKEELKETYFKRWEIEKSYDVLKNKLQIENISGKNDVTVRQDIYATIMVYNMIESISFLLKDEKITKEESKHEYKINKNILIGGFKDLFIEFIITENSKKKKQLYELFYEYVIRCKTAQIKDRSYPRDFRGGNLKCKTNMKRSF